jgi:hypothetical protein
MLTVVTASGLTVRCEVLKCVAPRELVFTWVVGEVNELNGELTKVLEPAANRT